MLMRYWTVLDEDLQVVVPFRCCDSRPTLLIFAWTRAAPLPSAGPGAAQRCRLIQIRLNSAARAVVLSGVPS
jgi:hypothetical protein